MPVVDLLIVGAGPSGLAAAIAAKQVGLDYVVLEKGVLVNSIFHFPPNMVFFTTPELLEVGGLPLVSPFEKPTRLEALRYYRRVADTYGLNIAFNQRVLTIDVEQPSPDSGRLFELDSRSDRGVRRGWHARAVVLAIGYYDQPNMLGVAGEDLPHVTHYYSEAHGFYRRRVVIVGGGNSAAESALDLYRAGAHVTLVHRHPVLKSTIKYWVKPDIENRIKEGSVTARFESTVLSIQPTSVIVQHGDAREELPADAVFLLTGYHPDYELLTRAGVRVDAISGVPCYNPETFESNIENLFLAGGAISGKDTAPIFIENGRFHGETIVKVVRERLS